MKGSTSPAGSEARSAGSAKAGVARAAAPRVPASNAAKGTDNGNDGFVGFTPASTLRESSAVDSFGRARSRQRTTLSCQVDGELSVVRVPRRTNPPSGRWWASCGAAARSGTGLVGVLVAESGGQGGRRGGQAGTDALGRGEELGGRHRAGDHHPALRLPFLGHHRGHAGDTRPVLADLDGHARPV